MILEDFVMLGKTIPEPNSDGRIFVCSAGCSAELRSLVRLYPLSRWQAPRRWTVNRVPVERKPTDSRRESFCLKGNRSPETHARINGLFEGVGSIARPQRAECLRPYMVKSIREANERRMSLAIVAPLGVPVLHFDEAANAPDSPQRALFAADDNERQKLGAKRFAYQPRLRFCDEAGRHDLQLRDWGCYEFMRKYGDNRRHELFAAAHLDKNPVLLVGNMNNQRTAWLVISVLLPVQLALDLDVVA
jgi:hypothetical protein